MVTLLFTCFLIAILIICIFELSKYCHNKNISLFCNLMERWLISRANIDNLSETAKCVRGKLWVGLRCKSRKKARLFCLFSDITIFLGK